MIYKKGSVDYEINLASMHEMEELIPMTVSERNDLHKWVWGGHDVDSNPWDYCEEDGSPMNYLKAKRVIFGASHGLWDDWEFASYWLRDSESKHLFPN